MGSASTRWKVWRSTAIVLSAVAWVGACDLNPQPLPPGGLEVTGGASGVSGSTGAGMGGNANTGASSGSAVGVGGTGASTTGTSYVGTPSGGTAGTTSGVTAQPPGPGTGSAENGGADAAQELDGGSADAVASLDAARVQDGEVTETSEAIEGGDASKADADGEDRSIDSGQDAADVRTTDANSEDARENERK